MATVLLGLLYLLIAVESRALDAEQLCSGESYRRCQCDASCALYGDCCKDAPSFVSKEQRRGASPFICDNSDIYMMSSCPAQWTDSSTRFHCEHPVASYPDPLFDVPVTSYRTNITYRNRHCALCHRDLDAGTTDVWSLSFSCPGAWLNVASDEFIRHLTYNTATSSWVLNMTANPELLIFYNTKASTLVYNCTVDVSPTELASTVLRTCYSGTVDTCPEDWTDEDVLSQCEAYTAHVCANGTRYRNHYCEMCNNNGSFDGLDCNWSVLKGVSLPDLTMLLGWQNLGAINTRQHDTELYVPFKKTCRTAFIATEKFVISASVSSESNSGISATDVAPDNSTMTSSNVTSNSSLDTCQKVQLEPHEYYIEDNDTMTVFISVYNMTLQPHEYCIDNDSRLIMCRPQFDTDTVPDIPIGIGYITVIGVSLSILFLVLHLSIFTMTPKLRNLSSMNLASLSVSLLVMYCSFFVGSYLRNTGVPCFVLAVIIHYTLLASFCWMLTIAYDINRVLRDTTTKLLLTSGTHWWRFGFYSLWSWTLPAAVIGAALAVNFSTDQVSQYLRPGYGEKNCYISNSVALLLFAVAPLFFIMVLNAVFFIWSACLIRSTKSELHNATTTRTNIQLYARLALIMGLTWAVGIIAGYVHILVVWYLFVILNALQGLFIFLAFTCTKKVYLGLREQLGLQRDVRTQGAKSPVNTGAATT